METKKCTFKITNEVSVLLEYPSDAEVILNNVLAGEYDMHGSLNFRPVILDIGANVGFFTIWSLKRWKPLAVHCYEPLSSNFAWLENNINGIPPCDVQFFLEKKAVEAPTNKLFIGKQNCGQATFIESRYSTKEYEEVESVSATSLPSCQILKVDTEGCEKDIISNYLDTHSLPLLVTFEYHSDEDRKFLDEYMYSKGYLFFGGKSDSFGLGTVKYIINTLPIHYIDYGGKNGN